MSDELIQLAPHLDWIGIGLAVGAVLGLVIGWLAARLGAQRQIAQLETRLQHAEDTSEAREDVIEKTFAALASQALKQSNQSFLQLANETLARFHNEAKGELEKKEKAVEGLVKPIRDALEKTEAQIREIEKDRKEAYGALHSHLQQMATTQQQLQSETRNLVQALRRPEVRGQWGEMTLRRLVELAGMVEHCDFFEQEQREAEGSRLRPDMIVRMPGGREIVVDVKTPLDAYLSAMEAGDDATRDSFLAQHVRNVRERVRELAAKSYWSQFDRAPDFVVLFIPGEQFLASALDRDRDLLEYALQQKVILATPTSLVALLRAVAYGWRQERLAENADRIRIAGEELYKRLGNFAEHFGKLGGNLERTVQLYNKAAGSFDSKLVPGARKLTELGVQADKTVDEAPQIETGIRELAGPDK